LSLLFGEVELMETTSSTGFHNHSGKFNVASLRRSGINGNSNCSMRSLLIFAPMSLLFGEVELMETP